MFNLQSLLCRNGISQRAFRPSIHSSERIIQSVELLFDIPLLGTPVRIGCKSSPIVGQRQRHIFIGHALNNFRRPLMLLNQRIFQCFSRGTGAELLMPAMRQTKPFAQPQQAVGHLNQFCAGIFRILFCCLTVKKFTAFFKSINVGLCLFICIHVFSFHVSVNMTSLACASDRGRQTYRSENVHPVKGSISLAIVSPTPFSEVYITSLKTMLLHYFNVVLARGYAVEGKQ
ncbi:putative membrane protein [Pectobacterium atrosepticum SCRI1043]|uniref:Membrane protein n=2 Tax=Pectobacterium atrosepticum TaxID=29471 RepID=Q6D9U6_PECAS|nr:hypothetical protein KCQ_12845 [Pectobacterium atrosepticum]CAG73432.1 putative membrane protein [Pectobacterium atrosepticum SCRI1043]